MNASEMEAEWTHIFETRIGILCGKETPTMEQIVIASGEADEHCEKLKKEFNA